MTDYLRFAFILSCVFLSGFTTYLNIIHNVEFPPNHYWFCALNNTILFISTLCSLLFIISMTFERFYSIIKPHKAASFNTVQRANIIIICIVLFSTVYNSLHLFISAEEGKQCVPYGAAMDKPYGQFYYWLSFMVHFAVPFVLLLIMNSFIIHTLRKRSTLRAIPDDRTNSGNQGQGQNAKMKSSEKQIFIILLLVTFAFLILTTPSYILFLYVMFYDYQQSAFSFAGFFLFHNVGQKTYYTNYGINFFHYVISGQKFRTDLVNLFKICKDKGNNLKPTNFTESSVATINSSVA